MTTLIFYDGKVERDRSTRRDDLLELYRTITGKTTHKYQKRPSVNWQESRVKFYVV